MTDYAKIKQRCAEDPEYRKRYLAMRARNNQKARDRAKAKLTPEEAAVREYVYRWKLANRSMLFGAPHILGM